jgi:hypothetical protein
MRATHAAHLSTGMKPYSYAISTAWEIFVTIAMVWHCNMFGASAAVPGLLDSYPVQLTEAERWT